MAIKKLAIKPGVNKENTRYTNEGRYWATDKVRFRQGTPEKIGGWQAMSQNTYLGVCRALFAWITLSGQKLTAVGTNLKYYFENGGAYTDITPIRATVSLTDPFATTSGSATVLVTDVAHDAITGDFVTFSGASMVGGLNLNGEYQLTVVTDDSYTIVASTAASSTTSGGGTVSAAYQINTGPAIQSALSGWGAGYWGGGTWGVGTTTEDELRLWSQASFGEDLVFGPRYGGIYYWDASLGLTNNRAVPLTSLPGASDVPVTQTHLVVSDVSRFVLAFGCNELGSSVADPLLIRWSDQEDATNWTPAATNQAGGLRLSIGSEISTALQVRQEILVWTDASLYSLQYVGAPIVWGATLLADNISCVSPNGVAVASGVTYWMGVDKFYKYSGNGAETLRCDLRQYIFNDINLSQPYQIFSGTNEAFNEVWWFYCSSGSTAVDRYVVYNYLEDIWYYGTMGRTAWLDTGIKPYPVAATYTNQLVYHEVGVDDATTATPQPIYAYAETCEFDIDDGDHFGFVWRILPDITFRGSTAENPAAQVTLIPMRNSGSGYTNPASVGGSDSAAIVRSATVPIEEFTGQVYVRVRGRQMILRIESSALGVAWQMGSMRIDIKQDGRR